MVEYGSKIAHKKNIEKNKNTTIKIMLYRQQQNKHIKFMAKILLNV